MILETSIFSAFACGQLNYKDNMREIDETAVRQNFPNVSGSNTSAILVNHNTLLSGTGNIPSVRSQLDQSELSQTSPLDFVNSPVQFQNPSLLCVNSSASGNTLAENLGNLQTSNFYCSTNSSSTSTKLPSLSHQLPISSVQRSFQSTTLSQFTPKNTPFVSHAFHNLGPGILGPSLGTPQYGTRSTIPIRHVSAPNDLDSNSSLVVKSESHYPKSQNF